MAPRLNKRQQREQEELLALGGRTNPSIDDSAAEDEEEEVTSFPVKKGPSKGPAGFAALLAADNDDEDDEEATGTAKSKVKKSKKKKKKDVGNATPSVATGTSTPNPSSETAPSSSPIASAISTPTTAGHSKAERKALKKKKAKEKKDDRDDIDKALAELSTKHPELKEAAARSVAATATSSTSQRLFNNLNSLLAVSLTHLDADAEMRKFFGARVVSASNQSSGSGSSRTTSGGNARRQPTSQRSNLTRPKNTWWPAKMREGLSLRPLNLDEVGDKEKRCGWVGEDTGIGGERWWTVEYSKRYKGTTLSFMRTVLSGDPEGFYRIVRQVPYHADTLLQLAEIYNHREEHSTAADFIERALFTYERAFVGAFTFTAGSNRLDFDRVENRPFFLALHRQLIDLQRRGTFRTAFEFARLLYSLDPWGDPHGALLHLDFLSVKAGMAQWTLDLWQFFESASPGSKGDDGKEKGSSDMMRGRANVMALPGWAYARALALRMVGKEDEATEALKDAVQNWPSVVPLLADKAEVTLSADVRGHTAFRIFTKDYYSKEPEILLHLLSHIYVQRSFQLWKIPENGAWLRKTVSSLSSSAALPGSPTITTAYNDRFLPLVTTTSPSTSIFSSTPNITTSPFAFSVYRHVIALGPSAQRLLAFLPDSVTSGPGNTLACDPLPPPITVVSVYNDVFFAGAEDIFAVGFNSGGRRRNAAQEQRMLEQMIPHPEMRRQFQDMFAANAALRNQFPGGVVQFAQVAANLPEDMLNDLLVQVAALADVDDAGGVGQGQDPDRMPGGMPGDEHEQRREWVELQFLEEQQLREQERLRREEEADVEADGHERVEREDEGQLNGAQQHAEGEEEEEDDEEEEEEALPLPTRLIRNLMSRFWGGPQPAEDSDDSSEDERQDPPRVIDDGGVD